MTFWLALAAGFAAPASAEPAVPPPPSEPRRSTDGISEAAERSRVVGEARGVMRAYARDLLAGDRAALAARYSRYGAWRFTPDSPVWYRQDWDRIRDHYAAPAWRPPARFEWFTLGFDFVDADTVAVVASVDRGGGRDRPVTHLYSALLIREQGELRIRIEHEAPAPPR